LCGAHGPHRALRRAGEALGSGNAPLEDGNLPTIGKSGQPGQTGVWPARLSVRQEAGPAGHGLCLEQVRSAPGACGAARVLASTAEHELGQVAEVW
jgi:hypothetical protein